MVSLYSYVRNDGYNPEDAQDLTQGFFLRLLRTVQAIGVAVHRLRQRYGECVRFEIGQTVTNPGELNEEIQHLYSLLG